MTPAEGDGDLSDLIRQVDALEDRATGYLTVPEVEAAVGEARHLVAEAIARDVLLTDDRLRRTLEDGALHEEPITLCRLNRHSPAVRAALGAGD